MKNYLIKISDADLINILSAIIEEQFEIETSIAQEMSEDVVKPHLERLRDNIILVIETEYVDKVYRDSYYTYYASKRNNYKRNCIKISLFEENGKTLFLDDFKINGNRKYLEECYRGFLILRPTVPYVVGRSAISPKALSDNNFYSCMAYIPSTAIGLKFHVQAFPYSSQDTETLSCAETMIWALMEYYGNKYAEYCPILPSKIISVLSDSSVQRQLPSSGLPVDSISYMLKECGFGPKLYSREDFSDDFETLLSCYIESGLPIIVALENSESVKNGSANNFIGHAVLCVGRSEITASSIDSNLSKELETVKGTRIKIKDWDTIKKEFIFIDDNYPAYQKEYLGSPTTRYNEKDWNKCKISHFIVPLYKRIYLEAYIAKKLAEEIIKSNYFNFAEGRELYVRTFLCSTRSYRKYVMQSDMEDNLKNVINSQNMPKFIWVTEVSDIHRVKDKKALGLILLDATEANEYNNKALIFALCNGALIQYDEKSKNMSSYQCTMNDFTMFNSNLKKI